MSPAGILYHEENRMTLLQNRTDCTCFCSLTKYSRGRRDVPKCSAFGHQDLCPGAVVRILVMTQNKEHQLEPSHVSSILSLVIRSCL